ncbi:hypothetical protein [Sediminicoccus rosea]|jgi:hypothetical protein|uniref:Uncharacterized protein n=1 Tax=Sediminicoccus rosea TaxID=1225128 RepID=A0ABZ0PQE3_9PROT|nr:hypothetical protein [Sediminicoccus rosea]WPB87612.1 hypothetical protein R9Z33_12190 [Sediminicoccus rosea]
MRKALVGLWDDITGPRTITVPCTVEIEQSFDSFHAHAVPEGIMLRPGDRVVVNGAPDHIAYGECTSYETTATVYRAGPITRLWTEISAIVELTELYHCGFEPKEYVAGEYAA